MSQRKTIELNIPKTADDRIASQSEWHCAGCGISVPDLVKRCGCYTMVACKEGHKSTWMVDPREAAKLLEIEDLRVDISRKDALLLEAHNQLHKLMSMISDQDGAHKETAEIMAAIRAAGLGSSPFLPSSPMGGGR